MAEAYHGILNINKPKGWTSHDVVARVRRLPGIRRAGHAGTLDPLATGVLLVCVGHATRLAEYLMGGQKVYRAVAQLGVASDTYDSEGTVTAQAPVPPYDRQDLQRALAAFVGQIVQTPPPFSAVKQDGVPAYRRARRGEKVELAPRRVQIHSIEIREWEPPHLTIEVRCDAGTYIRSVVHDLGRALGCGAILAALTRLQSGAFTLDDAVALDELAAAGPGQFERYLYPMEAALGGLTPVPIDAAARQRLLAGQPIPCPAPPPTDLGYAREANGDVRAILAYRAGTGLWWPRKVFPLDQNPEQ